jgi:formate dehydrogenase subunit delta
MNTVERLVHMVNQIAKNFAIGGEGAAVVATAKHITDFWDPRMKRLIIEHGDAGLDPIAAAAIARIVEAQLAH